MVIVPRTPPVIVAEGHRLRAPRPSLSPSVIHAAEDAARYCRRGSLPPRTPPVIAGEGIASEDPARHCRGGSLPPRTPPVIASEDPGRHSPRVIGAESTTVHCFSSGVFLVITFTSGAMTSSSHPFICLHTVRQIPVHYDVNSTTFVRKWRVTN